MCFATMCRSELLLAGDNRLVFLKACREEYLSEIDFREPERASVSILLALEAVVVPSVRARLA